MTSSHLEAKFVKLITDVPEYKHQAQSEVLSAICNTYLILPVFLVIIVSSKLWYITYMFHCYYQQHMS